MGFTLADLKRGVAGSGIDQPPDIDVLALLADSAPTAEVVIRAPAEASSSSRPNPTR